MNLKDTLPEVLIPIRIRNHAGFTATMSFHRAKALMRTTEQEALLEHLAEDATMAKTSVAEGDALRELSKIPGVLEEGILTVHHR